MAIRRRGQCAEQTKKWNSDALLIKTCISKLTANNVNTRFS